MPTEPKSDRPHMPGYGISKGKKGMLPWSWAEERFSKNRNYYVSTVRPDGRPHIMPVWGVWLDNRFYFSTGADSRKARNLAANPQCAVATENATEVVILEGAASVLSDRSVLKRFAGVYKQKYDWDTEHEGGGDTTGPIFEVTPRTVFGFVEAADKFGTAATRWKF